MKQAEKIIVILINITAVLIVFTAADYAAYKRLLKSCGKDIFPIKYSDGYTAGYEPHSYQGIENNLKNKTFDFRHLKLSDEKEKSDKPSDILLFGCSYTYGSGLEDNQTLNAKLASLTGRKVYNFGIEGAGAQHMLHMLRSGDFKNHYLKNAAPGYAVYTYIANHLERQRFNIFPNPLYMIGFNLKYKFKDNKLENNSIPLFFSILGRSYAVKTIFSYFDNFFKDTKENQYKLFQTFNETLLESRQLLQEMYPDIKFVFLNIRFKDDGSKELELPFMRSVLENEGFIYIDSEETAGRKFEYGKDTVSDNIHPNEQVWDVLAPEIIKKLNIQAEKI